MSMEGLQFAGHGLEGMDSLPIVTQKAPGNAKLRVTPNPIYDSEVSGTSAITDLSLFRSPEGGVFQNATSTKKTLADTNLKQQGQLGSPLIFDIVGFQIKVTQASGTTPVTEADLYRFYVGSYFEFSFNNRPFLQIPTFQVPAGVGIFGVSNVNAQNALQNGVASPSAMLKYMVGKARIRIRSTENFNAKIQWASSVTFVASVKVSVYLNGYLYNGI